MMFQNTSCSAMDAHLTPFTILILKRLPRHQEAKVAVLNACSWFQHEYRELQLYLEPNAISNGFILLSSGLEFLAINA